MKAMVINEFGSADCFREHSLEEPNLSSGQVKIHVKASSVNPIDIKIRSGLVPALAPDFPAILHGDVAGTITEVSPDVKRFNKGDEVFALGGGVKGHSGALAEYMVIDERLVARKPEGLSMEETAALPVVSLTAWEALMERGKIKKGDKILIHGAAGGVGHIAVQLAKSQGAHVTTTVSDKYKADIALKLGADEVVYYKEEKVKDYVDRVTSGKGFHLVFDTVGKENLDHSFQAAAVKGTVISTNTRSTHDLSLLHGKGLTLHVVFLLLPLISDEGREKMGENLSKIADLAEEGRIKPMLHKVIYGFSEVKEAHQLLEKGKHIGKISLLNDLK
ncbi:NADPH2:quinone reductase [Tindallia magadiensis]|uniref:NADPH2:quinone reductase n=1 Tax=Tindallia magadiensis TaxID=69895 RepID=A0A1I3FV99_9FIRM|nr:zinc-dependent alcohol dehydrogenase family protein [Tindallia magadiensis]SFI15105.1 NADPH2:quinone reductase [Tindallia magadiensis]